MGRAANLQITEAQMIIHVPVIDHSPLTEAIAKQAQYFFKIFHGNKTDFQVTVDLWSATDA